MADKLEMTIPETAGNLEGDTYRQLLELLRRLEEANIWYRLGQCREDAIMIEVAVPGERWEIEFVDYDDKVHVEIERFRSDGHISDESALEDLFANFSDKEEVVTEHVEPARK